MGKEISFLLYKLEQQEASVQVIIKDETIWATQKAIAQLFGVQVPAVNKHLLNIYNELELDSNSTISKMEQVQIEGTRSVKRQVDYYNLDAIIAVGYRVNSAKATKFRIWATSVLNEYIKKGFVLDDERLKQVKNYFGQDYIRELLERGNVFNMQEFAQSINEFLNFRKYKILPDNGKISAADAQKKAFAEYEIFNKTQKINSDFDKLLQQSGFTISN